MINEIITYSDYLMLKKFIKQKRIVFDVLDFKKILIKICNKYELEKNIK